ncbi:divalent-cation tolerance protein CutA [Patescibacteria group bacterium]|nr:divalent-cation tolerance protein CutA [Patescibacteria group bacterium]
MIIIYVTFSNHDEARRVCQHLLEKKLIACANFFPVESMFNVKGKTQKEVEIAAYLKTKNEYWQEAKKEIEKEHSYSVPCVLKIDAECSLKYDEWLEEELD